MRQRRLTIRLQVGLLKDELKAIDDFWFAQRLPSRAEAVRELLRRGLNAQKGTANEANEEQP